MSQVFAIGAEEALLSDDPIARIFARGAVSGWVEQFQAWVNDEFSRTSGNADLKSDLIIAIGRLMVATHSSFVANLMNEDGFQVAADAMKDFIDKDYVQHALMCQAAIREQRGAR